MPALALAAISAPAVVRAQTLTDVNIVAIFDAANTADIETGRLTVARSHNKEVHDLGQAFADVHASARQLGRDLAKMFGVVASANGQEPSLQTGGLVP